MADKIRTVVLFILWPLRYKKGKRYSHVSHWIWKYQKHIVKFVGQNVFFSPTFRKLQFGFEMFIFYWIFSLVHVCLYEIMVVTRFSFDPSFHCNSFPLLIRALLISQLLSISYHTSGSNSHNQWFQHLRLKMSHVQLVLPAHPWTFPIWLCYNQRQMCFYIADKISQISNNNKAELKGGFCPYFSRSECWFLSIIYSLYLWLKMSNRILLNKLDTLKKT